MCGVTGFWGPPDRDLLEAMTARLAHRGPDGSGFSEHPLMSLGHRRLIIIDAEGGAQPMASPEGDVEIAYNGEVYNFRELRRELEVQGRAFRTRSDTEVVLEAYRAWGTDAFARLNGMWAVAIADHGRGRLVLSRDHFGIKPLYLARSAAGRLLFGSEIKALLADPDLDTEPDPQLVYEYLRYGLHDHRRETFFRGVWRLPAATVAVVDSAGYREETFWRPELRRDGDADPGRFRELFRQSVERRLVADVPVGTCLSGGLDSSTIVSFMTDLLKDRVPDAASLRGRVKTFSAVFDGDPIDEREFIEEEIRASGADSLYVRPDSKQFVAELADLVYHQDEPFVSTGPYAQWCVMRTAAREVKVVLDGQGGDELVAGYVPYHLVYLRQLWRQGRYGAWLREAWAARDVVWPLARRVLRARRRALPIRSLLRPEFLAGVAPPQDRRPADDLKARLLEDLTTYSLPALLRYEDRNSMAHSIESRVPWLDPELVARVLSLPESALIRDGWSRAILRQGMRGLLPEKIRRRRWKVGFTTPEARWLFARRAVFQSLLRSPLFASRPYWDGAAVARAFARAARGQLEASMFFWRAINVEVWLRVFFAEKGARNAGGGDVVAVGDRAAARMAGPDAEALLGQFAPNPSRHLFCAVRGAIWLRAPVRTPRVAAGDDLLAIVAEAVRDRLAPGDLVAVSERVVSISQGRSYPLAEVRPSPLARGLARFVRRTPSGIGLGVPETMELARREAGGPRLVVAAVAAALTRPLGLRGTFYRVAGHRVAAIDGPTPGTLPPYDGHAKLPPHDPDGFAARLSAALGGASTAVVDVNDLGANILGATAGVDRQLVAELLTDNPLGQGAEQTPVVLIRRWGSPPRPVAQSAHTAAG